MRYFSIIAIMVSMLLISSCGPSKKATESSAIATYTLPGADLVTGNGLIRGWGVGRSDSEATAHKKARMEASAALAATLEQIVQSTTEEYTSTLSEGDQSMSMSFLNQYTKAVVNQTLTGATTIFDRWGEKTADGQYVNYVVMELKGEDFLKSLYKTMEEKKDSGILKKELLEEIFIRHIDNVRNNK